jgi:ACT domain-containing protein
VNAAIQVIQHMNSGMTVVDACKEIGLRRSSFYDIVKKYPEAIAEYAYQEMVEANAVF